MSGNISADARVWSRERLTEHCELRIALGAERARVQSPYQLITVHETEDFGRLLRLDECNMTSERDEHCYHEPMVHPALLAQSNPKSALIIGGGDGGAAKEVLKHRGIARVVIAELDEEVVRVSRQWLGAVHQGAFDDPRLALRVGDGFEFLRRSMERFDLVVLDITDPLGNAEALYTADFFVSARDHLSPSGVLTTHIGSPFFHQQRVNDALATLRSAFTFVCPLSTYVPIYGAQWGMACASMATNVAETAPQVFATRGQASGVGALRLRDCAHFGSLFLASGAGTV
jgi:spermidine synthase